MVENPVHRGGGQSLRQRVLNEFSEFPVVRGERAPKEKLSSHIRGMQ